MKKNFLHSANHYHFFKNICAPILFILLLSIMLPALTLAQTARTAESMLGKKKEALVTQTYQAHEQGAMTSRKTEEMLSSTTPKKSIQNSGVKSSSAGKNIPPAHVSRQNRQSHAAKKHKPIRRKAARHVVNGVKLEILSCKYVPEYKSVTCDFKATNLEPDIEAVMYCYTGTEAIDETGNQLQCAHVWLGSNHSWNYAHGKLLKGTPVKGMIRLETGRAPRKLKTLKVSLALNGTTESALIKNIPVQ